MGGAALLALWGRPTRHVVQERMSQPLEQLFPERFGAWQLDARQAALVRPAADEAKRYGIYDQVLERVYIDTQGQQVMLSVAYGSEQSPGLQAHRPEVCYPSGGFRLAGALSRQVLSLAGQPVPVTQLHAERPGRSEPITYWVVLGDEAQADEQAFRWRQLRLGLRGIITDGMLVRVSSLDRDTQRAHTLQARFADEMLRAMAPTHRLRAIGKPPGT
jgi:EpsI family protein